MLHLAGACTTGFAAESGITPTLQNEYIALQIGERGLEAIHDRARNHTVHLDEAFLFTLDGREVRSGIPCSRSEDTYSVTWRYCLFMAEVEVNWELLPVWHFASKQLAIYPSAETVRIDRVEALRARMDGEPYSKYRNYIGRYAAFLRMREVAGSTRADTNRSGGAGPAAEGG